MATPKTSRYYLVEGSALPEVFIRVTEARQLLDTGQVKTVAEAADRVGISRSAYYKYKNAVMPFEDMDRSRILTFQIMLHHKMGVLCKVLSLFAETGANILTINQGIPTNGAALVTISADTAGMDVTPDQLLGRLSAEGGVIKAAVVAG